MTADDAKDPIPAVSLSAPGDSSESDSAAFERLCISKRKGGESVSRHALREILLIESGRNTRHRMGDEEMWQAMTDLARAALEADRGLTTPLPPRAAS